MKSFDVSPVDLMFRFNESRIDLAKKARNIFNTYSAEASIRVNIYTGSAAAIHTSMFNCNTSI